MPDVLEAPLVAKTFDDGYGPTSAGRSYFRLGGLSLSPWTWSLGSSMSGGVEVSARGGLRLATTHSPYVVEEGTTPASLHRHHPHHLQHQRTSRYYPHLHPLNSSQQHSSSQPGSHHQRQHLSNLENLSHRRPAPLHLLHPRHAGKSAPAASGGRCVPLTPDTSMRANERWVLLNKETFQEIFDATLHQMTYAPGELLSGGGADDRKSSTSSSDRDAGDGAESPPSPTTPDGLRCQRAAPALCSRKRTLSDVAAEQEEAEAERSISWRRASPLTAMAPTESAKTTTSALNDITNDRPGQRYSPAISSSAGSSTPTSPRLTSPGAVVTSPHSPQGTVVPPNPDRENNEPLDLSNKRSPTTEPAANPIDSDSCDSNNAQWSPRPSPNCSSNNNNNNAAHLERATSPPTPAAPTGDAADGAAGGGPRQGSPGLAPPSSTTTTNTVPYPDRQTQPPPPRMPPAAAELRQKASPEGGPVRANGSYAPVDPRAPSPRGTEAGGGGSRGGVAAGGGRLGEEDARGGTLTTTTHPALAAGGESSSSSSSSQHAGVEGRGAGGGGGGGGGSSSSTDSSARAPVSSVSTTEATSCSSSSRITTTTQTTTCNNNTTIAATTASTDTQPTSQQTPHSHRDTRSPNSLTPHTCTSKTLPDGATAVSRMIADASGDPAATVATSSGKTTTTSVTSRQVTTSGQAMKHASENWMLLNKTTVYDLVEEVMFSLGEDEEEKVSALRDSSNHRRTMSPAGAGSTPLQHQHQSQQQSKSCRTAPTTNNNNNNNALKRTHAEMDGSHTGRRHRCSPPLPLERCVNQGQAQEERMERADDNNSSSRPAAGTQRPTVSTTKSQLRDHLSARSQQAKVPPSSASSRVPNHSDPAPRERLLQQQQQQLTRCSPVRNTCVLPGDSSSTTSPTSKTKQQQCWVALNKNLVYNIVDSAMRSSETEEDEDEEIEKYAPSDPKSEVNGHGPDGRRVGLGGGESDSNSNSSCGGESDNTDSRSNPNPISTSDFETHSQQMNGSKKRPCDNIPSCGNTGATLEEAEYIAKRSRVATPSPPVCSEPASPLRTSLTEGPAEGIAPSGGVSGARRTCLEGLLSEAHGRRTPPAPTRQQPHKPTTGEAPMVATSGAAAANNDGGSQVRKSVHLADYQASRIDRAQSATSHPQKADGNVTARSPSSTTPCGASSKNQSSSHRGSIGSNQVSGTTTATGRGAMPRDQVNVVTTSGSGNDVTSHTKHGLVPLPASKHGLVPVSPSPTDARSSPRLGWVAVSKVDVHNIVDSVVDSMITGDPMTSSSSTPPPEVDTRANPRSPVPSPPSSSMSPPHQMSSVTSPVPARDAESSHRASSPLCPSLTVGPRSPHQPEPERRGRGTPSPVMASPGSPRSPCDVLDRSTDSKAATKAFKWKSSLLMRVEEEKIDVTPEVATTSGRSGSPRVGGKPASKSESRSLRSGKRGSRKGGSSSTSKLK